MGSVQDYLKCSVCGGLVISDFNYKTMEEWLSCQSCGRHYHNNLVSEDEPREDGRHYFMKDEHGDLISVICNLGPHGAFAFMNEGGGGMFGSIEPDTTLENWREHFNINDDNTVIEGENKWKEGANERLDMTRSHITFYDPETKEFTTVWGAPYEHEVLSDEYEVLEWKDEDEDLPFGTFLSENAPQELAEKMNLTVLPPRE